jgi:hypothetical protein
MSGHALAQFSERKVDIYSEGVGINSTILKGGRRIVTGIRHRL